MSNRVVFTKRKINENFVSLVLVVLVESRYHIPLRLVYKCVSYFEISYKPNLPNLPIKIEDFLFSGSEEARPIACRQNVIKDLHCAVI